MRVARHLLPIDQSQWHGFLRDYFCDKDATPHQDRDEVELHLEWPSNPARHVDPRLQDGLRWWGRGVSLESMWQARWREGRILTALYDTWTLLSWSEWLANTTAEIDDVVILHVDDHRDLASPRLITQGHRIVDAITGHDVSMRAPASVLKAIDSGAIGMGSFMTPFICEGPKAIVRHLCQPPKLRADFAARLVPSTQADSLLYPGASRPAVRLAPDTERLSGPGSYLATPDPNAWCKGIDGRPTLVHIDMDYFNNRYDGDSDWPSRPECLDPELPSILAKIDELVDALASSRARIEDVTIAYSPGFFPAEYWAPADTQLRAGLAKIL